MIQHDQYEMVILSYVKFFVIIKYRGQILGMTVVVIRKVNEWMRIKRKVNEWMRIKRR